MVITHWKNSKYLIMIFLISLSSLRYIHFLFSYLLLQNCFLLIVAKFSDLHRNKILAFFDLLQEKLNNLEIHVKKKLSDMEANCIELQKILSNNHSERENLMENLNKLRRTAQANVNFSLRKID